MPDLYELQNIGGKKVFIVESHHHVLLPWRALRNEADVAPNLITLDHHTDTHPPFLRHVYWKIQSSGDSLEEQQLLRTNLVLEIRWQDESSVQAAIEKLQHDEHIQAATLAGIINYAFVIHLDRCDGTQIPDDNSFMPPEGRVFVVPHDCFIGCEKRPHDDECALTHANQVLESTYLTDQLQRARELATSVGIPDLEESPYILDIDLDFFHTRRALAPSSPETFNNLIRRAMAITIAKEPGCTADLWLDNHPADIQIILDQLLAHIQRACAT